MTRCSSRAVEDLKQRLLRGSVKLCFEFLSLQMFSNNILGLNRLERVEVTACL